MGTRRAPLVLLVLVSCLLLGDDCDTDRDALRESRAREDAAEEMGGVSLDPDACLVLPAPLPAGLSLVPGVDDRVLVADPSPAVIPVDVTTTPPSVASPPVVTIPDPGVSLDGVVGLAADLALATDPGNEQVLFVNAESGVLRQVQVGGVMQTAIASGVEVTFPDGALDSAGNTLAAPPATTSFTSGAAAFEGRLFVSTANGQWSAGPDPVYLPGTVLIYDLDLGGGTPVSSGDAPQVVFTTGFNPSEVTPYTSAGERRFVLVTTSGAIGLVNNSRLDFATSATAAARAGRVEVIEVFADADPALVALIPLDEGAPAFGRIAVDPSGRVGALGSLVGVPDGVRGVKERRVLAVDLGVLDDLPAEAPDAPLVLDGSDGSPDARIDDPSLEITPIAGGPGALSCSGTVVATAWTPDGRLLAAELCDGTLSSWGADVGSTPPEFTLREEVAVVAPFSLLSGELQAPVDLVVRGGDPAAGPDVFLLLGLPGGALCGIPSAGL
jgi:hypothetical protein